MHTLDRCLFEQCPPHHSHELDNAWFLFIVFLSPALLKPAEQFLVKVHSSVPFSQYKTCSVHYAWLHWWNADCIWLPHCRIGSSSWFSYSIIWTQYTKFMHRVLAVTLAGLLESTEWCFAFLHEAICKIKLIIWMRISSCCDCVRFN